MSMAHKERREEGMDRKSFFVQPSLSFSKTWALVLFTKGIPELGSPSRHCALSRTENHAENSVSHIETQPESGSLLSEQKLCFPPSSLPAGAKHLGERDVCSCTKSPSQSQSR